MDFQKSAFEEYIRRLGGIIIQGKSDWEVTRFRMGNKTGVVYINKRGEITLPEAVRGLYRDFQIEIGELKPDKVDRLALRHKREAKDALLKRDGNLCFYCGKPMNRKTRSLEHFVPVTHGGPNHISNFALAHIACNSMADDLPVVEKILLREQMQAAARGITIDRGFDHERIKECIHQ